MAAAVVVNLTPAVGHAAPADDTVDRANDPAARVATQRSATIDQLTRAVEQNPHTYAGVSTRGDTKVVIHLAGATSTVDPEVTRLRDRAVAQGITVSVDRQPRSLAALNRVHEAILSSTLFADRPSHLVSWRVDVDTNSVEVGVTEPTPDLVAAARKEFGDTVRLVQRDLIVPAAGRLNDRPAFYGGDRIWGPHACTFGFTVTDFNNNRLALTAGHCYPMGVRVTHNSYSFGTVSARSVGGSGVDSGFVWGASLAPRIWTGGVGGDNTSVPVQGVATPCTGCAIEVGGSFSGQRTAMVTTGEMCINVSGNPQCHIREAVRLQSVAQPICQPGDSGGPVFSYNGAGGVSAVGIITGYRVGDYGVCYYTSMPAITAIWGVSVTTAP
jgi:hypothetical protein